MADNNMEKKKKGGALGCLIVLILIVVVPSLVLVGMYFVSYDFQMYSNSLLSSVPGFIGEHFSSKPTRADHLQLARSVSEYIISLDVQRASDKLKVLDSKDGRAYDNVVKDMLRINPNKTKKILDLIRKSETGESPLQAAYEEITGEKIEDIKKKSEYIASLPNNIAADEITIISSELNGHKLATSILEHIDTYKAMQIIYRLENDDKNKILNFMNQEKADEIKATYASKQRRLVELDQIATVLKKEEPAKIANALTEYSDEDKAIVLRKLGARIAGKTLTYFPDRNEALKLIGIIKSIELAENEVDEITPDIIKSLKVYKDFDDNVKELSEIYMKMDSGKVSQIIRDMLLNAEPPKVYNLSNGDNIELSNKDLIKSVLESFPQKRIAEILSNLDNTVSSEITRMLVMPNE